MQIGTGNNRLPGCAPTANDAAPDVPPVTTAPVPARQAPPAGGELRSGKKALFLVVALLLAATAGAFVLRGHVPEGKERVRQIIARLAAILPGMGSVATTNAAALTPTQRQWVSDYSPARPINDARRVKELVHNREAGQDSDVTTNTSAAAVPTATVAAASNPPTGSEPAPVASGQLQPSRPPVPATHAPEKKKTDIWPEIRVTAIIGGANSKWIALINKQLVKAGDRVDGATVVVITADHVTMACNGEERDFLVGARR